jgi:predicted Zn-dependent protease
LAMGNWQAAEALLSAAKEKRPDDPSILSRLGILHARKGRPDLALPELETLVRRDPTQLEAKAELGFLYFRGGDPEAAAKVLRAVLAADPRQPYALLYLGHVLYEQRQPAKAEESFKAAAHSDPGAAEPHYALGQLYEAEGKKKEALAEYQKAATLQKDHPYAAEAAKRIASQTATPQPPASSANP